MKLLLQVWLVLVVLLYTIMPHSSHAQSNRKPVLTVSYFGEFIGHPGFKAGINIPLAGQVTPGKRHSLLLGGGNIGAYYHKGNHTGLFLEGELGYRFTTKGGFKFESFLSAGYHRSFVDGPVFRVNARNEVTQQRWAGQNTVHASLSLGFGKQLKRSPIGWHIRPGFMIRGPHNSSILPHLFIETGVTYNLGW